MSCCDKWDPRYGCSHEVCPSCYGDKHHEQNVCDECHAYNVGLPYQLYIDIYGIDNLRTA